MTHLLGNRYVVSVGWMLLVACSAFFAAVLFALVIPMAIAVRSQSTPPSTGPGVAVSSARAPSSAGAALSTPLASAAPLKGLPEASQIDALIAVVAAVWAAGAVVLLIRLGGGWWMARSLIKTALRVEDAARQRVAEHVAAGAGVSRTVMLLESADVEAPVVLGWRKPALILPLAALPRLDTEGSMDLEIFISDEIPMDLAPGQSADVTPSVLTQERLDDLQRKRPVNFIQYSVGVQSVRFANGFIWSMTPNPAAKFANEAIMGPPEPLPRSLIARDASKAPVPFGGCKDDDGRTTTSGGLFEMLNEPGRFIQCENGRWVEGQVLGTRRR